MGDFLKLIWNPFAVMIVITSLDGILESTTYKPKVRAVNKDSSQLDSTLKESDGTALGNSFPIDGNSGDLKVFINGVKQVDNFTIVGNNVVMDSIPAEGVVVCAIKVPSV